MDCPYCDFHFGLLLANGTIPDLAPLVCENCGGISLVERGNIRMISLEEIEALKQSPAWEFLEPVRSFILKEIARKKKEAN